MIYYMIIQTVSLRGAEGDVAISTEFVVLSSIASLAMTVVGE